MPWWLLWKRKVQGADVARLEAWEPGGPSLAGGNFLGIRMPRQDLSGIDLSKANLTQADLRRADLERASLSGAELVGVNLQKANLEGTNLSGILTRPSIPEDLKTAEARRRLQPPTSAAPTCSKHTTATRPRGHRAFSHKHPAPSGAHHSTPSPYDKASRSLGMASCRWERFLPARSRWAQTRVAAMRSLVMRCSCLVAS